jgi:hypothetical protein
MVGSFTDDWLEDIMDAWQFAMKEKDSVTTYFQNTSKFLYATRNVASYIDKEEKSIESKFVKKWVSGLPALMRTNLAISVDSTTSLENAFKLARKIAKSMADGTQSQELADAKRKIEEMTQENQAKKGGSKRQGGSGGDVNVTLEALVGRLGGQDHDHVLSIISHVAQSGSKVCYDFLAGRCTRGSSCKFAHENGGGGQGGGGGGSYHAQQPRHVTPPMAQQPFPPPPIFMVPPPAMPPLPPGMPPGFPPATSPVQPAYRSADDCRGFQKGKCTKGTTCPFSHPPDHMPARANYCFDFKNKKSCTRGDNCPWKHLN